MRCAVIAFIVLTLVGCASTTRRVVLSGFEDVPVPKGLKLDTGESTMIESPSVKAARQVYTGRIEGESLGQAFRTALEANGWRHVSTTSAPGQGTSQVYEKEGNSLQVRIYDRWWWTVAEITTTRVLVPATSSSYR